MLVYDEREDPGGLGDVHEGHRSEKNEGGKEKDEGWEAR